MCTRYFLDRNEPEISSIIDIALTKKLAKKFQIELSKPMITSGEVRPSDVAPVLAPNSKGDKTVYPMKWGFTISVDGKQKAVVNARIETASEKALFSEAWKKHRCIIPASWYFEWNHIREESGRTKTGDKYLIQPENTSIVWLGGLYRIENGYPVFVVLTKSPTEELSQIHDRMPLILPTEKIDEWIHPDSDPSAILSYARADMIIEKALT